MIVISREQVCFVITTMSHEQWHEPITRMGSWYMWWKHLWSPYK